MTIMDATTVETAGVTPAKMREMFAVMDKSLVSAWRGLRDAFPDVDKLAILAAWYVKLDEVIKLTDRAVSEAETPPRRVAR